MRRGRHIRATAIVRSSVMFDLIYLALCVGIFLALGFYARAIGRL
jgi:hypothetical protein